MSSFRLRSRRPPAGLRRCLRGRLVGIFVLLRRLTPGLSSPLCSLGILLHNLDKAVNIRSATEEVFPDELLSVGGCARVATPAAGKGLAKVWRRSWNFAIGKLP